MKKQILIAMVALLGFSSCKKTIIINEAEKATIESTMNKNENYNVSIDFVKSHNWTIKLVIESNVNGQEGIWKLQESKGTNNWLYINKAPANKYWQKDANNVFIYKIGTVLDGIDVSTMNIDKSIIIKQANTDSDKCACGRALGHAPVSTGADAGCNGGWLDDAL